jgi:hypothetical protein
MAAVTVLAASRIDQRKMQLRLTRMGCVTAASPGGLRVWRHSESFAVDTSVPNLDDLSEVMIDPAAQLLGSRPRGCLSCSFDGPADRSGAWNTVVDIARAVAAVVPLAVLDDHAGTSYLIHPTQGLIGPEQYEAIHRISLGSEMLRRLLGKP